jgi:GH25 family lysozyme M1 (1,4-beta-N-acetylmuramidase)
MTNPIVVDISHHQADVDFGDLKAGGTVGVILKATEGTSYLDPTYIDRNEKALRAGLMTAPYHFLKPGSIEAQMKWFLAKTQPADGSRLVIDYEADGLKISDLEASVRFLRQNAPKCELTVYGANGFLGAQLGKSKNALLAANTSLWVASYRDDAPTVTNLKPTWPFWSLWQYTDKAQADGVIGPVDGNRWNGNGEALKKWFDANFQEGVPDVSGAPQTDNTPPDGDIGWAINKLRFGKRIARSGWNGKNMYLELQTPDANSKMTLPYVYMRTAQGDLVPWLCSQTDLLATDWQTVD